MSQQIIEAGIDNWQDICALPDDFLIGISCKPEKIVSTSSLKQNVFISTKSCFSGSGTLNLCSKVAFVCQLEKAFGTCNVYFLHFG